MPEGLCCVRSSHVLATAELGSRAGSSLCKGWQSRKSTPNPLPGVVGSIWGRTVYLAEFMWRIINKLPAFYSGNGLSLPDVLWSPQRYRLDPGTSLLISGSSPLPCWEQTPAATPPQTELPPCRKWGRLWTAGKQLEIWVRKEISPNKV